MAPAELLVELGAILLGLGLLGAVAVRFSISPIPLYLLAGLAFGRGGVWPLATSQSFIAAGAEVGVILLLFGLGLEYAATELVASMRTAAPAGLADLILNAGPGLAAGVALGYGWAGALALGGITYATSSGITAKLLRDLGWLDRPETPRVLSLLVFEDLAMAGYLPVLTAVLAGGAAIAAGLTLASVVAVVLVILVVALRYGAVVERLIASPSEEVLLLKAVGLAILVAGVGAGLGLSAPVGAFLVGIALSGPLAHAARQLLAPLRDLFAAVFFVFFGLQTDPGQLPPVAGIAIGLAVVGIVTKVITGALAAGRAGGGPGRLRAGSALIARGEFSIVIAGLAVSAGGNARIGPLAAAYVLVLAVAGPLLARAAEPTWRLAVRVRGRLHRARSADGG